MESKNATAHRTTKSCPQTVKSVFVNIAYSVKAIVTVAVIAEAVMTDAVS